LKPLALLLYSNLLPGSQLAARLQDMGYRVQTVNDSGALQELCEREKPLVLLAEVSQRGGVCDAIAQMKKNPATGHIPVLAFAAAQDKALQGLAEQSGISLLVGNAAVLEHLPQLLDQVLQVE
jgi:CheY-like chemotaxis protein